MTLLFILKALNPFALPLGTLIIVSTTVLALSMTRWWRVGLVLLGLESASLWIAATPVFANWLNRQLESKIPPTKIEELPQSDVVILLGGVGADFPQSDKPHCLCLADLPCRQGPNNNNIGRNLAWAGGRCARCKGHC